MMKRKILAVIVGIITLSASIITLFSFYRADTVAQQEIEHYFVGFAASKPSDMSLSGVTNQWVYYDYEGLNTRTEDWSSWYADEHISNFAKHDFGPKSFTIDVDRNDYLGTPDYNYKIISQYSSDANGLETNGFVSHIVELPFYDPVPQKTRVIRFYKTFITLQMTLRVVGQYKIVEFQDIRGNSVPYIMYAEFQGNYQQNYGVNARDLSFLSKSTTMRIVVRIDVRNWKFGDYIHIDPNAWNGLGNAVIWSKITSVDMSDVDQTAGWDYPLQFAGDFDVCDLELYSNIEDALMSSSSIPSKDVEYIELGDTLYPTVYFNLDHSVWLGTNMELLWEGNLKSWDVSDFFVKFKITSCIISTWMESEASEGQFEIENPFKWEESVGSSNDWFTNVWNWLVLNLGGGRVSTTLLYIGLALLIIFVIVLTIINPAWIINFGRKIAKSFKRAFKKSQVRR